MCEWVIQYPHGSDENSVDMYAWIELFFSQNNM